MAYLSSRVVLLTFLYFIQGLPYGLQARFLPVYLRTKGLSLTSLGFFKMLLAPWLCKALWAPLVDKYATKQKWLLASIVGLMATCAVTSMIPPDNMYLLCFSIFSLNLFAATQDIAVDSIALTILPSDELGKGNTAQVVGYKIGAIFGGGILVWFMDVLGWMGLFLALTLLYIEALLFVYLSPTLRVLSKLGLPSRKPEPEVDASPVKEAENQPNTNYDDITKQIDPPKDTVSHEKITTSPIVEKEEEDNLSKLLKNALDFIETKDNLEKDFELRHQLKVEELGSEERDEIVKHIMDHIQEDANESDSVKQSNAKSEDTDPSISKTDLSNPKQNSEDTHRDSSVDPQGDFFDLVKENLPKVSLDSANPSDAQPGTEGVELGYMDDSDEAETLSETGEPPEDSESQHSQPLKMEGEEVEGVDEAVGEEVTEMVGETGEEELLLEEEDDVDEEGSDNQSQDSFTCSSVRVSGHFAFLWEVITVPNTGWIMIYVLIYKLGEQGALGMLPLFLVDQEVKPVDVTFWTGVVGQATSMVGSCLGGWILSHPVYRLPCRLLIYQLSLCRLLPLGLLLWVVMLWSAAVLSPTVLYRGAVAAMNLLLLVSGMVTTATFTLMMECSQSAPRAVQATHYTLLSSMEVFGKLSFMSVCGALVDYFGYTTMYLSFVVLAAALLPWLWRYPDILCEKKQS